MKNDLPKQSTPSLGPTGFLFLSTPNAPAASPRNTIIGHAIGTIADYFSLVVTGLTNAGPTCAGYLGHPFIKSIVFYERMS